MQRMMFSDLLSYPGSLAGSWTGLLYLPVLVSPDQSPLLYLLLILVSSVLAGGLIFFFCRFYYRDINLQSTHPLAMSLLTTAFLTALIVYQAARWPGLSILMVSMLAVIHFRSVIRGMNDLLFVFWAILSGLFIGMGLVGPVLLLDALICLGGYLIVHRRLSRTSYHFIISCDPAAWPQLSVILTSLPAREVERRTEGKTLDLVLEVSLRDVNLAIVDQVSAIPGVRRAVMVAVGHSGNMSHDDASADSGTDR